MNGDDIIRGTYHGWDFDVTRVVPGEFGPYLLYRTGDKNFNIKIRGIAKSLGMSLNEHGLFNRETGELITAGSEEEILNALNIPYVKPEDRESY